MDGYYNLIKRSFIIMGFDYDLSFQNSPFKLLALNFLKLLNIICLIISTMQCLISVITESISDPRTLGTVAFSVYSIQTLGKLLFYLIASEKVSRLSKDVRVTYNKFKHSEGNEKFFRKSSKVCSRIFLFNNINLGAYSLIALVRVIQSNIMQKPIDDIFPVRTYWPFDPFDYLPWTLLFNAYTNVMTNIVSMIAEQIFVFVVAHMIAIFDSLNDELMKIIEEIDKESIQVTKKKLEGCIVIHNELIGHAKRVNSMLGFPLFLFLMQSYCTICFLEFLTTFEMTDFTIPSVFALLNIFVQILMLAYHAELLQEKVSC